MHEVTERERERERGNFNFKFLFFRVSFNVTEPQLPIASKATEGFLDNLPGSITDTPIFTEEGETPPTSNHTHYLLPFQVYYVGQSYRTVPYTHEDSPTLRVLAQLMGWKYLHKEIRYTCTCA